MGVSIIIFYARRVNMFSLYVFRGRPEIFLYIVYMCTYLTFIIEYIEKKQIKMKEIS